MAGGLIKTGAGNLILSGANTYILGTAINGGTITIVADNNLGNFDGPARNGSFPCYQSDNLILNTGTLLASNTFTLDTRAPLIILNAQETPYDGHASVILREPLGEVLPAIVAALKE